jgi:apolipoprotein N-acyltransferase
MFDHILLGSYLSCYFVFFGLFSALTLRHKKIPLIIAIPSIWVASEYLRAHAGFLSLPIINLGHSQFLNLPIIQISSFTGEYGVSFLIVLVNVAVYSAIQKRGRDFKPLIYAALVLFITLAYGYSVLSNKTTSDTISVTVIQGNISLEENADKNLQNHIFNKQMKLTGEAIKHTDTSLIVWPEGAVRGLYGGRFHRSRAISKSARDSHTSFLVGSYLNPKTGQKRAQPDFIIEKTDDPNIFIKKYIKRESFNAAFLFSDKGILHGKYNKMRLLPFAEYLPYKDVLPWPSRYRNTDDFIPGEEHVLFSLNNKKFGTTICWENVFSDLFREFVKKGADFMVNMTNEVFFGKTAAPYHFLSVSVFRAVENRISIARAANTGISGFISPYGRIIGKIKNNKNKDIFLEGYLTESIPLREDRTFYTQYGDIFAYFCIITSLTFVFFSFLIRIKKTIN